MEYDHKEYPKMVGEKDYWGQVKRTVNGQAVREEDIAMITSAIRHGLELKPGGQDCLLDLGCGNGALTSLLYDSVRGALGVDFSEYLIQVAKRDFQEPGRFEYEEKDVYQYLFSEKHPERFNKVLMYGCFSYFHNAQAILNLLRERFTSVERVFIGNIPDLSLAGEFYYSGIPSLNELRDPESKIGVWRTESEFRVLAEQTGWRAQFLRMPAEFYSAHYRYDVVLKAS